MTVTMLPTAQLSEDAAKMESIHEAEQADASTSTSWSPTAWKSQTFKYKVGCGNIYFVVDFNDSGTVHRIRVARNSKFRCSLVMRDVMSRQSTFQVRREPAQLVADLREHQCEEYYSGCQARSCYDAMAKVITTLTSASHPTIPHC
jgi:hypothetical protein